MTGEHSHVSGHPQDHYALPRENACDCTLLGSALCSAEYLDLCCETSRRRPSINSFTGKLYELEQMSYPCVHNVPVRPQA
jgi:hypothetical protein